MLREASHSSWSVWAMVKGRLIGCSLVEPRPEKGFDY